MYKQWLFIPFICLFLFVPSHTSGWADRPGIQNKKQQQPEEVFLTFNYQNLFNKVVVALYEDGQFYLPVSDILSTLEVPHEVSVSPPVISGSYLNKDNTFQLNFTTYEVTLKNRGSFTFNASKMLIRETDFYVTPEVFSKVFDLNFSVDFNNLLLNLETPHELPVVSEFQRAQERKEQERFSLQEEYYPLKFDRDRKIFAGGFLDYSLSANLNPNVNFYTYNFSLGTEVLGGDLQGSAFGSYSQNATNFITDNFRWRYAWRNNDAISQLYVGQTSSDGLFGRRFVGVSATNEPIEPRYIYDEIEIEGDAAPGSEVELYFNDALYDYKEINQNGRYRFLAPLTYGSSRLRLKIYDPAGGVREIRRRIQVPFNFLRPGELNYHVNVGRLENPIFGSTQRTNMMQGDLAYGLTNWLTQKVGVEYLDQFPGQTPLIYSSTSARLFKEYLVNIEAAPSSFYRISTNAIYASSGSWDLGYTYYTGSGIYNTFGSEQEFTGNVYMPFSIYKVPFNIRLSGSHILQNNSQRTRYSVDLNTRLSRLNLRMRYSDLQTGNFQLTPSTSSEISTSASYYVGRGTNLPSFMEGTFLRGQLSYNPNLSELTQSDVQISRNIFENGRIQASFSRNFRGDFNLFSFGLTIDFPGTRTSTTVRSSRDGSTLTQNVLGSIGYDHNGENLIFSNRQQVGRAATSVRLYVDKNNSGTYDSGEKVIKNNAVRIGRSGVTNMDDSGIIYLSQLQAYNRMNMEINQSAIKNPMLIPEVENFSIVTDPNQYKPINIPFYTSGVVSGKVIKLEDGEKKPLSGLRVYLDAKDDSYSKEMRTFNDGTFYAYEIPPGSYSLYIDRKQLNFLEASSKPDTMNIEVEPLAEGDFVEGLSFTVVPKADSAQTGKKKITKPVQDTTGTIKAEQQPEKKQEQEELTEQGLYYQIQLASFRTLRKAEQVAREATKHLGGAFSVIQNTNNGWYAIRSAPMSNRESTTETIISYHNNSYKSAALVILENRHKKKTAKKQAQFIQLGAYSTQERAEAFANKAADKLDEELAVTFNEEQELYKVYINKTFNSESKRLEKLSFVKNRYSYQNAFITNYPLKEKSDQPQKRPMDFSFQIEVKGVSDQSEQKSLSSLVTNSNISADISQPRANTILFTNIATWDETKDLQQKISQISNIGHPIVILIEKVQY